MPRIQALKNSSTQALKNKNGLTPQGARIGVSACRRIGGFKETRIGVFGGSAYSGVPESLSSRVLEFYCHDP